MTLLDTETDLTQMETWIETQKTRIRSALVGTMNEVGGLVSDELIQRLNIPYPPASKAGQDPHRRTGQLSAGIHWLTDEFYFGVVTNVVSSREGGDPNVPLYLEEGTTKMAPREYILRTREAWETKFPQVAEDLFWKLFT